MNGIVVASEIFFLFIFPVFPSFFDRFPKRYCFPLFWVIVAIACTIVYIEQWPLQKLGIDARHLLNGLPLYFFFTLLGFAYILLLVKMLRYKPTPAWWKQSHFIFGFILISAGQEFLYRGFLMPVLESVFSSPPLIILINALLFTFIHIIYRNRLLSLTTSFLGGICFAGIYYLYPNLILISLSHAVLNFAAVYYGMFTF